MSRYLRTGELARAAGIHVNTVRLYEQWGLLPPARRAKNNYRLFTEAHLEQLLLARTALHEAWPGREIRRAALAVVKKAAAGETAAALALAEKHLGTVLAERAQAEAAAEVLAQWARGRAFAPQRIALRSGQAAALLGVSYDMLRNWERNGLLTVPRDPRSGYRAYGAAEIARLRVIRLLSRAGYSLMAILRMLLHLEQGGGGDLRRVLDTPRPDEDAFSASDRWLSSLTDCERRARKMIAMLEAMLAKANNL